MSICLSMIVRNESHVLRRALESAKPFVDKYCIVDTGSTDGTQDIIKEYGELHERPWVDFATNRNQALQIARYSKCDYILFLDADDVLVSKLTKFQWPSLTLPGYTLPVIYGETHYTRCALIQASMPWRWEGVIHEYLTSDTPLAQGQLTEPVIKIVGGGARSLDPEKFKKDAALLEAALAKDPSNARYAFYLAQSYKDAGMLEEALAMYRRRAQMVGFYEETFYAMYMVGLIKSWRNEDPVIDWLNAFNYRPQRMEPLYHLARWHRLKGQHALGYMYAKHGMQIKTSDVLFVDRSIYDWRMCEELALNAWYVGKKDEGRNAMLWLLEDRKAPEADLQRFKEMMHWYD